MPFTRAALEPNRVRSVTWY